MTESIEKTAAKAVQLLLQKSLTVATAESCTAGLLSAAITEVSGASAVFACGITAYSADIKAQLLHVPTDVLDAHGTVSTETATAMASNVQQKANASIGIAITGVAGPATSEGKPVGTVHIALADANRVWNKQLQPSDTPRSRREIRLAAVQTALEMLVQYAAQYPLLSAGSMPLHPQPAAPEVVIPTQPATHRHRRFLATVLPWKNDTRKERLGKIGSIVLGLCVVSALAYGVLQLVTETGNRSLYSDLQNIYTAEQQTVTDSENGILPRFSSLYLQNADIGGWIRIENTGINYPVMKNAGSNYYATHNFHQQSSNYGVPYFDKNNHLVSADEHNKALIVYGNNTQDGQMFSDLTAYRNPAFFREHAIVEMSTLFSTARWQLFAVVVIDPNEINAFPYNRTVFDDAKTFTDHVDGLRKRSLVKTDVTVTEQDELLVLVTDAEDVYHFDGATIAVIGKRLTGENSAAEQSMQVTHNHTVIMPRAWVRNQQHTVAKKTTTVKTTGTTVRTTTLATVTTGSTATTAAFTTATSTTAQTTTSTTESTETPITTTTAQEPFEMQSEN